MEWPPTVNIFYTYLDLLTIIPFLSIAYSVHCSCRRYTITWVIPSNLTFSFVGLLIIRIYAAWPSKRLLTFILVLSIVSFSPFHHQDLIFELDDQVFFVSSYIFSNTTLGFNSANTTPIDIRQSNSLDFRDNDAHIQGSGSGQLSILRWAKQRLSVRGIVYLWTESVISSPKIPELMHESVLLCLMLFIKSRKYKNAIGPVPETYFRDTTRYMIYIMSKLPLFRQSWPWWLLHNVNPVTTSFSIILIMAPPVRCNTAGVTLLLLLWIQITWVSITNSWAQPKSTRALCTNCLRVIYI